MNQLCVDLRTREAACDCDHASKKRDANFGTASDQIEELESSEHSLTQSSPDICFVSNIRSEAQTSINLQANLTDGQETESPLCNSQEQDTTDSTLDIYNKIINSPEANDYLHTKIAGSVFEWLYHPNVPFRLDAPSPNHSSLQRIFGTVVEFLVLCNQVVDSDSEEDREENKHMQAGGRIKSEKSKIAHCKTFLQNVIEHELKLIDSRETTPKTQRELFWQEMMNRWPKMLEEIFEEIKTQDRLARIFDPLLNIKQSEFNNGKSNSRLCEMILNRFTSRSKRLLKKCLRNDKKNLPGLEFLNVPCKGPLTFDDLNVLLGKSFRLYLSQNKQGNPQRQMLKHQLLQELDGIQTTKKKFNRTEPTSSNDKQTQVYFYMHFIIEGELLIDEIPQEHLQKAIAAELQIYLDGLTEQDYKIALDCIRATEKQPAKLRSKDAKPNQKKTKSSRTDAKREAKPSYRYEDSSLDKRPINEISSFESEAKKQLKTAPQIDVEQYC